MCGSDRKHISYCFCASRLVNLGSLEARARRVSTIKMQYHTSIRWYGSNNGLAIVACYLIVMNINFQMTFTIGARRDTASIQTCQIQVLMHAHIAEINNKILPRTDGINLQHRQRKISYLSFHLSTNIVKTVSIQSIFDLTSVTLLN